MTLEWDIRSLQSLNLGRRDEACGRVVDSPIDVLTAYRHLFWTMRTKKADKSLFDGMPPSVQNLQKQSRKELRQTQRKKWKEQNEPKLNTRD